jgi:hypothetical protein
MMHMLFMGLTSIAHAVQPNTDTQKQCGVFGESYLLKPLVHYLSRWDVKKRKEAEARCSSSKQQQPWHGMALH